MYPKVICHIISSVDGRLLTDRWTTPFDGKSKNELLGIYAAIGRKLDTDAWMFGKRTLTEGFFPRKFRPAVLKTSPPPGNLRSLPLVRTPVHRGRPRSGHSLRLVHRAGRQHRCHPAGDDSSPAAPEMQDIGILASTDPVALVQACLDLVYAVTPTEGNNNQPLIQRIESRGGAHVVEYAERIGLGSRNYEVIRI